MPLIFWEPQQRKCLQSWPFPQLQENMSALHGLSTPVAVRGTSIEQYECKAPIFLLAHRAVFLVVSEIPPWHIISCSYIIISAQSEPAAPLSDEFASNPSLPATIYSRFCLATSALTSRHYSRQWRKPLPRRRSRCIFRWLPGTPSTLSARRGNPNLLRGSALRFIEDKWCAPVY